MEELTEWALEKELEQHTREQRESLMAIDEAITLDSANEELLLMKEELMISVKAAEHSLLQLKRARLLQEVDTIAQVSNITVSSSHRVEGEAHERPPRPGPDEREAAQEQKFSFAVGSRCRFRHTNGRWYNGKIFRLDGPGVARVSFLTPTTEQMQSDVKPNIPPEPIRIIPESPEVPCLSLRANGWTDLAAVKHLRF